LKKAVGWGVDREKEGRVGKNVRGREMENKKKGGSITEKQEGSERVQDKKRTGLKNKGKLCRNNG